MLDVLSVAFGCLFLWVYPDLNIHFWSTYYWVVGESLATIYVLLLIVRYAYFFTQCVFVALIATLNHLSAERKTVEQILSKSSKFVQKRDSFLLLKYRLAIEQHLREHNLMCYIIVTGADELFSSTMACFVYTNVRGFSIKQKVCF